MMESIMRKFHPSSLTFFSSFFSSFLLPAFSLSLDLSLGMRNGMVEKLLSREKKMNVENVGKECFRLDGMKLYDDDERVVGYGKRR